MLKQIGKTLAQCFGYEVMGPPRAFAQHHTLAGLLQQQQINLVLDVGANEGQFAAELRTSGYTGKIVSYEPLPGPHEKLCGRAKADPAWIVADRTAVGDRNGMIEINVSATSYSSSVLPMLPEHSSAAPDSAYVGRETVPIHRLDDLYRLVPGDRALLKVDVQGYEQAVLAGAPEILAGCRAIIIEMSLVPLYGGQLLALELWNLLASHGFEAWALETGFRHKDTWRMMQVDGLFVRKEAPQAT